MTQATVSETILSFFLSFPKSIDELEYHWYLMSKNTLREIKIRLLKFIR